MQGVPVRFVLQEHVVEVFHRADQRNINVSVCVSRPDAWIRSPEGVALNGPTYVENLANAKIKVRRADRAMLTDSETLMFVWSCM